MERDATNEGFSATVRGMVQGVGFRYAVRSRALRLGVCGFVKNLTDGSVQVECEGPAAALQAMAAWLRTGPAAARVIGVDIRWRPRRGYATFTVEY